MLAEIENKREEIAELCKKFGIKSLAVFGSAARDDFNPESSDIDLLVEWERPPKTLKEFFAPAEAFEQLFGRKVDLVTKSTIRNPYLIRAISRDERLLYAA